MNHGFARWLWRMSLTSTIVLLLVRVFLVVPVDGILDDFHKKDWVFELQQKANGLPVVFANSYRDPSMYYFYTGERPEQFTDIDYRANQYDLWPWEAELHGKQVLLAGKKNWDCFACPRRNLAGKDFRLKTIQNLQVSQMVRMTIAHPELAGVKVGDAVPVRVHLTNPYSVDIKPEASSMPLQAGLMVLEEGVIYQFLPFAQQPEYWPADSTLSFSTTFAWPYLQNRPYTLVAGIKTGDLPPAINSFQITPVVPKEE